MRRTRKWAYVAQEAKRLAELGLRPAEIAKRLEVERRSVDRWMTAGQLRDTRQSRRGAAPVVPVTSGGDWGASVRATYALDATDEALVSLGEVALQISRDPRQSAQVQFSAGARFQSIAKQLALVSRDPVAVPESSEEPKKPEPRARRRRRSGPDPRTFLTVVK